MFYFLIQADVIISKNLSIKTHLIKLNLENEKQILSFIAVLNSNSGVTNFGSNHFQIKKCGRPTKPQFQWTI